MRINFYNPLDIYIYIYIYIYIFNDFTIITLAHIPHIGITYDNAKYNIHHINVV